MKNLLKTALVFSLTILTISCGNPQKKETHFKTEEAHTLKKEPSVELNNGNLWIANPETTTGIKNMRALMQNFSDTESVTAYTATVSKYSLNLF